MGHLLSVGGCCPWGDPSVCGEACCPGTEGRSAGAPMVCGTAGLGATLCKGLGAWQLGWQEVGSQGRPGYGKWV